MAGRVLGAELRVVRETLGLLSPGERRQLAWLVPPMLLVAVFEVAGVASLAPFIALLSEPERFADHRGLAWIRETFGFTSTSGLFFFIGVGILVLLTVGNSLAAFTMWSLLRFSWTRNATLSTRLLRSYLYRPYPFFLERNTSELMRKALSDVNAVTVNVIWQMMSLCARSVVILFIAGTLVVIDPVLAVGAIVIFGGMYGSLFLLSRRWVMRAGKQRMEAETQRFRIAMEALTGAKEIKLYRLEENVADRFGPEALKASMSAANQSILAMIPRYALETVAFGGVLAMVLYLLKTRRNLEGALPLLGLYAFAAVRLLPALQAVFAGVNALGFHSALVGMLRQEFAGAEPEELPDEEASVPFEETLDLSEVTFSYATSAKPVLDRVSLTVRKGDWVVLVGPTGSGKSTLIDIMLGLLEPTGGAVRIDGVELTRKNRRSWQARTAYVPQQIFLVHDTVEANICFGVPKGLIDQARLEKVAKLSQVHEFVTRDLPDGYQTIVGDRGIRLSGGQRQRVGIARALYREPDVLVLDEATSALDQVTEAAFFHALRAELSRCTVVSITHRLTTARTFDRAYQLERGVVVGEPRPADLAAGADVT